MSKNAIKSMTLQGVLIAALGASGASGSLAEDPQVAATIDKIASAAGLLLATFGRLRQKNLHIKAAKAAAALFLVAVLAGCGTVRALAGPDPEFAAAAPGIGEALDRDSAAHPEFKEQNDKFKEAMEAATKPGLPDPPPNPESPTDWLMWSVISAIGLVTGRDEINRFREKRKAKKAAPPSA